MKEQSVSRKTDAAILLALMVILLIAGAVYVFLFQLPKAVEEDFGEPDENLSWLKRTTLAIELLRNRKELLASTNSEDKAKVFTISAGDRASTVAHNLEDQDLISDEQAFINYLVYKGYDTSIQQGEFDMETGLAPVEIAAYLIEQQKVITVWRGYRLEEVAEAVASKTTISAAEFLAMAQNPADYGIISFLPIDNGLEGFLYPQNYAIKRENLTAFELITAMLLKMESVVTPEMMRGFEKQGISVLEAFTMASMIERETTDDSEMAKMASVFYNRRDVEMMFQSDPTVQYALRNNTGTRDWWPNITQADYTSVVSPYNTYLNTGFPPGPICMPSEAALWAVAKPEETEYYYFRSCPDDTFHQFSATHTEHENACP